MSGIDLYSQAVRSYQTGNLAGAASLCRTILSRTPWHLEAMNLLAVVEAACGNPAESIRLTEKLLKKAPASAGTYINLSGYYQQLSRWPEALKAAERGAGFAPGDASALAAKALCQRMMGDKQAALLTHQKELESAPSPLARMRLADTLYHFADYEAAVKQYESALAEAPQMLELRHNYSMALQRAGQHEQALNHNLQVITQAPHMGEPRLTRGSILQQMQRYEEAAQCYREALERAPGLFDAAHNLACVLQLLGRAEESLEYCRAAIGIQPASPSAHSTYANALLKLGHPEQALSVFNQAVALDESAAAIRSDRANCLMRLARYDEAEREYEAALACDNTLPNIYTNRGWLHQQRGHYGSALRDYDQALALDAEYPSANFNKATWLLLHGDFAAGWEYYEARWKNGQTPRQLPMPEWKGEPLHGKTILLHAEQGLGDTIQFCRYAAQLAALGATVTLEVPSSLQRLMQTLRGPAHITTPEDAVPVTDYHLPLMSLPRLLETTLTTIPAHIPYLRAEPRALPPATRPRIGIAWSGNSGYFNDHHRSIPLALFAPILAWDAEFHALQPTVRESDQHAFAQSGIHLHPLNDMADTASLIMAMDQVITIDSAPAHLAGALGVPVTVLLPFSPDFRWLLRRSDSPWYPTATLVRQPAIGDWQTALNGLSCPA